MKIIYEKHPVTKERKAYLRGKGYRILDAVFAPADYKSPEPQQEEEVEKEAQVDVVAETETEAEVEAATEKEAEAEIKPAETKVATKTAAKK